MKILPVSTSLAKPLASVATHRARQGNYRSELRVFLPASAFLHVFSFHNS